LRDGGETIVVWGQTCYSCDWEMIFCIWEI
jgi:hypothetical protein